MKHLLLVFAIICLCFTRNLNGQATDYSAIDKMIVFGNYGKAVDTCRILLQSDSANAAIWYKMGLAQLNMPPDTGSFACFLKAAGFDPENNLYKFTVAKGYFSKNKYSRAKPMLEELCHTDSINWPYAYYLTNIYILEGKYDRAIDVYKRFYNYDSTNYVILDKLGFAYLKKSEYQTGIDYYNRSLALNKKNIDAIRNLSYLYPYVNDSDTAIVLLTGAIGMEPDDVDLYARRATINFSKNYTKRALNDYLKILSLGDSSVLYLKRAGIGYMNNLQPRLALPYLMKANVRDTTDFETLNLIAQCYYRMDNHKQSAFYYDKLITLLKGFQGLLSIAYQNIAREQKLDSLYTEAIASFSNAYKISGFPFILIYIANIYDENLMDAAKALSYYKQYLAVFEDKTSVPGAAFYSAEYKETIKNRVDYLERKLAEEKAKKAYESKQR